MSALPLRAPCAPCACAFRFRPRPAWRFAPFSPTSASASISGGRRNRSFQCLPIAAVGRPDEAPPLLPLLGPVSASSAESLSRALARSLVLAFLASKARSLFAVKVRAHVIPAIPVRLGNCKRSSTVLHLQATVELLLQCYAAGMSVDEVQVEVSGLALASGGVLSPLDTEVLTSWAAVVFLTARSCGASRGDLLSHFLGPDSEAARAGLEAGDAPAAADGGRQLASRIVALLCTAATPSRPAACPPLPCPQTLVPLVWRALWITRCRGGVRATSPWPSWPRGTACPPPGRVSARPPSLCGRVRAW